MTRSISLILLMLAPTVLAFGSTPASAGPDERAVIECRAELLSQFPAGSIRNYRVASIEGTSRRTRVNFIVNADRRYIFECAAGRRGEILLTSFEPSPPSAGRLASGQN